MEFLIHFLKGYVRVQVYGYSPERFLNLCSNHGILLWDIEKSEDGYNLCLHKKAFFALKPILKKTGTRVRILQRYGFPFTFPKMKKRWLFIAGCLFAFLFWCVTSHFIWSIDVEGNEMLTDDMVEDFLASQGVYVSMSKKALEIEQLEQNLRDHFEQITWTSLQLTGTKLTVYLKENQYYGQSAEVEKPQVYEHGADLVADLDGEVASIITRAGEPKVKAGDTVVKGQVLVSGTVPIYDDDGNVKSVRYYTADADVILQGVIPFETKLNYVHTEKVFTGKNCRVSFLQIGKHLIEFDFWQEKYLHADVITENTQLSLMEGVDFPVFFGHSQYFEYLPTELYYTDEEMREQLSAEFVKFMENLREKGVQIIAKDAKIRKNGDVGFLSGEIAVKQKATTLQAIVQE